MRIRKTDSGICTTGSTAPYQVTNNGGASWFTGGYNVVAWNNEHSSTIVDEPGHRYIEMPYGGRIQRYKPVSQVVWTSEMASGTMDYQYSAAGHARGVEHQTVFYAGGGVWPSMHDLALSVVNRLVPMDPYYGHYSRWESVKPTMTTRANLAVFLGELRDIKRMFELFPSRHFSVRNWRDVLKYANDQHLNYNFGWKPFLRDLRAFKKAYETFDARLRKFVGDQCRVLTRHRKEDSQQVKYEESHALPAPSWYVLDTLEATIDRSSTFMFAYEVPKYSYNETLLRAWMDSLGLALTPANVWALVPWSFVFDWFENLGGFLKSRTDDWLQPFVYFVQACTSVRAEGTLKRRVKNTFYGPPPTWDVQTLAFRMYSRAVGVPQFTWDEQSLNADKIRLLASLGASRIL